MNQEKLKGKIRKALKQNLFTSPDDLVDVSNGANSFIHVVVVSRKFESHSPGDNHDLLWTEITKLLKPEEWGKITLSVGVSPEDIKCI